MAATHHIENPLEFLFKSFGALFTGKDRLADPAARAAARAAPQVRRVTMADLGNCLRQGFRDFAAARDDVVFIAIIYPLAGLALALLASRLDLLPMVFPLVSGFAILGPLAAVGLYEISRRRERGEAVSWTAAFGVLRSPALGAIVGMGLILTGFFVAWLFAAYQISTIAFPGQSSLTPAIFVNQVAATGEGWRMALIGLGVGALFAAAAFAVSVISFPLLLDKHLDLDVAIGTSVRVVMANPVVMAAWGAVVAGMLVLGALPALFGLVVVLPVLGHASWHLYRKAVEA